MTDTPAVTVRDDPERGVFLAVLDDGTEAGGAYYRHADGVVTFTHTEVPSDYEGQGVGSTLARGALDAVRERGERVVAECPFIKAYVERHPEYQDLLAA
ncbi:GNAT family N-acetyltransferase [Isoptericola sp. AK164]|uniref:GNAT family N-acetyltransferase n=1 Tax=Isoptericola sp. AK164 TaxID=3024246 RepID=UPI00241887A7|nr:GNAT family N-acetyltransferase [Isoptericola sp. AK164]